MRYPGTYALPYDLHVDKGTVSSGTVAGLTLAPLVIDSVNGEVDGYFSLWFREPYEARYVQLLLESFWWVDPWAYIPRCYWRVLVWNFVHERWEQTPANLGDYEPGGSGVKDGSRLKCPAFVSAVDRSGPYTEVNPGLWLRAPESTNTVSTWIICSLTQAITSQHIDARGRAAVRLVAWPSPDFDTDYQVRIRAVFGCRNNYPLPRTYQLELGSTFKAEYQGTYELTWQPGDAWTCILPDDGGSLRLAWRHAPGTVLSGDYG